jgi:hypothetical protein
VRICAGGDQQWPSLPRPHRAIGIDREREFGSVLCRRTALHFAFFVVIRSIARSGPYLSLEQDAFERLQHCAVDIAANRRLFAKFESSRLEVFSTAVLVDDDRFDELQRVLEAVEHDYLQLGVAMDISGPWPPYSFCGIDL